MRVSSGLKRTMVAGLLALFAFAPGMLAPVSAKAGVPSVSFNPGAKFVGHSDKWGEEQFQDYNQHRYHQPSDEYSPNWNFGGMVQQARLAFWIGLRVANATDTPQWNRGDEFERARLKSLGKAQ